MVNCIALNDIERVVIVVAPAIFAILSSSQKLFAIWDITAE